MVIISGVPIFRIFTVNVIGYRLGISYTCTPDRVLDGPRFELCGVEFLERAGDLYAKVCHVFKC